MQYYGKASKAKWSNFELLAESLVWHPKVRYWNHSYQRGTWYLMERDLFNHVHEWGLRIPLPLNENRIQILMSQEMRSAPHNRLVRAICCNAKSLQKKYNFRKLQQQCVVRICRFVSAADFPSNINSLKILDLLLLLADDQGCRKVLKKASCLQTCELFWWFVKV